MSCEDASPRDSRRVRVKFRNASSGSFMSTCSSITCGRLPGAETGADSGAGDAAAGATACGAGVSGASMNIDGETSGGSGDCEAAGAAGLGLAATVASARPSLSGSGLAAGLSLPSCAAPPFFFCMSSNLAIHSHPKMLFK